jgi:hypothetical protein
MAGDLVQKARKCFRRSSGRLPAMIAALIAPIETTDGKSSRLEP